MSGPGDRNGAGLMVEYQVSQADKHILLNIRVELTVDRTQHRRWGRIVRRLTAQDAPGNRHDKRRGHAFTGNIRNSHPKAMIINLDVIEIVPADLASRKISAGDLKSGNNRRLIREQTALDLPCNLQIMIETFFLVGLGIDDRVVKRESGLFRNRFEDDEITLGKWHASGAIAERKHPHVLFAVKQWRRHYRGGPESRLA